MSLKGEMKKRQAGGELFFTALFMNILKWRTRPNGKVVLYSKLLRVHS